MTRETRNVHLSHMVCLWPFDYEVAIAVDCDLERVGKFTHEVAVG